MGGRRGSQILYGIKGIQRILRNPLYGAVNLLYVGQLVQNATQFVPDALIDPEGKSQ